MPLATPLAMPRAIPFSPFILCTLLAMISLSAGSPARNFATIASPITERSGSSFLSRDIVESTSSQATAYLRVASLSIALYDYLSTLPGEYRLYASQPSFFHMSNACILFIAVRYMSIVALVISNVGFFGAGFSPQACQNFHLAAPVTKLLAVLISQVIVSIRTYAISRKSRWVFWTLSVLFVLCLVPELLGNVYKRIPLQDARKNCTSGNIVKVVWLHYLAAVVFDAAATGISSTYLILNTPNLSLMSGLSRLLLKEGMAYFVVLTAVNVANLVLFRTSSISTQSSAASLGQAVTMIMSGHIILTLQDWRAIHTSNRGPSSNHELGQVTRRRGDPSYLRHETIVGARSGPTALVLDSSNRHVLGAQRSKTFMDNFVRTGRSSQESDPQLEIRVQVDEEVKVDYESDYTPSKDTDGRPSPVDPPDERPADRKWSSI